ncbi:MAG TPA: alpha-amylase family glycosyl hydrolase, partial [Polyangiaceae bacterium]|nr:alpha-amylase family glycosyl hydrolase [Polyangiaceae bacterium]
MSTQRPPVATYRIQLRQGFGFDEAAALVGYLAELGISHVYLSPCQRSAPGSTHGYDVTDPTRVDEDLGGEEARQGFLAALTRAGLEHMVDIVPNHMSVASEENRWWWDVLENGPYSAHAQTFDVEFDGPTERSKDKVLLPILGSHYGRALEASQIQ